MRIFAKNQLRRVKRNKPIWPLMPRVRRRRRNSRNGKRRKSPRSKNLDKERRWLCSRGIIPRFFVRGSASAALNSEVAYLAGTKVFDLPEWSETASIDLRFGTSRRCHVK